jgi:dTDP-4-amino-4,6-dideoxygalactose transaminase
MYRIPFNRPTLTGNELHYIKQTLEAGHISGDGFFSQKCSEFLEKQFGCKKALLTPSCTDAMEIAAILMDLKEGDEVILPSFAFVTTANAFHLRGARPVFVDIRAFIPCAASSTTVNLWAVAIVLSKIRLPIIPSDCQPNFHMFYVLFNSEKIRNSVIKELRKNGILAVFHYLPLHTSPMGMKLGYKPGQFPITEQVSERLLRLPFFNTLTEGEIVEITERISRIL